MSGDLTQALRTAHSGLLTSLRRARTGPPPRLTAGFEARVAGHATVDEQRRPGDVVGHIRGEIDRSLRDILRLADALVWHKLHQVRVGLRALPSVGVDVGSAGSGPDGVYPDAIRRQFLRQALHHHLDAPLAGGVIDVAGPWDHLVDRTHADDLARRDGAFLADTASQKLAHRLLDAE